MKPCTHLIMQCVCVFCCVIVHMLSTCLHNHFIILLLLGGGDDIALSRSSSGKVRLR